MCEKDFGVSLTCNLNMSQEFDALEKNNADLWWAALAEALSPDQVKE